MERAESDNDFGLGTLALDTLDEAGEAPSVVAPQERKGVRKTEADDAGHEHDRGTDETQTYKTLKNQRVIIKLPTEPAKKTQASHCSRPTRSVAVA